MMFKKIKKIIYFSLLILIFTNTIFAIKDYNQFENSYIEVKCGKLKDNFFLVKYDEKDKQIYIGVSSLYFFLEIYNINVDLKNMSVKFLENNKTVYLNSNEAFVEDDDLFVNIESLKTKFDFKSVNFNSSMLILNLIPNFLLPYEQRNLASVRRLKFDNLKREDDNYPVIAMKRKFITPGFFKVTYNKYDIQRNNDIFLYEYGNQFLYGSFYLSGQFIKKNKINYGNLTYYDIWKKNDLVIGNINFKGPSFISHTGNIIGISLNNQDTYFVREGNTTVIKGEAEGAITIELYRGPILLDYIHPFGKNFKFRISDGNIGNDYNLKIYYANGNIENRKVFSINDLDMVEKGKYKINFQLGKVVSNGDKELTSNCFFGLTDNITVGMGYDFATSYIGSQHQYIKGNLLYNSRHRLYPTLIDYKVYHEVNKNENNIQFSVTQKVKNIDLKFSFEEYSKHIYEETKEKNFKTLSLGYEFNSNFIEFGWEKKKYYINENFSYNRKNMFLYWNTYYFNPLYFSLKVQKNQSYEKTNFYSFSPTLTYNGYITTILEGMFEKNKNYNNIRKSFNLKFMKRNIKIGKDINCDLGSFIRYSSYYEKIRYGVSFNIKFDDFIYVASRSSIVGSKKIKDKGIIGIEAAKLIDLQHPFVKISNESTVQNAAIYGKVYFDKNNNGKFDENEPILKKVGISINSTKVYTNERGEYLANDIVGNSVVELEIDRKTLDPILKPKFDKVKIKTLQSGNMKFDIPVQFVSIVSGNIINKSNLSEKLFSKEMSYILIRLEKDDKIILETKPEFDGMYYFEDVFPGKYKIEFITIRDNKFYFSKDKINIKILADDDDSQRYIENCNTELIKK